MYEPNIPNFNNFLSENIKVEIPNIEPIEYEDTLLKDMANDIISSQLNLENKIDMMIEENKKSGKANSKIALWTLIVALLTLVATVIGVVIQLF